MFVNFVRLIFQNSHMTLARDPKQYVFFDNLRQHLGASESIWEHLGGTWEASGRALGGPWVVQATWEASGRQMCSNTCVLPAKVARATISRARDELDLHVDGKFTAT